MYENVEDRKRVKFCGFSLSQMMSLRFCQEIRCAEQLERYTHAGITRNAKTFPRKAVKRKARGGCKCVLQGLRASNESRAKSLPIGGEKLSIREATRNVL